MLPKSLVILRVIVTRSPAALLSISYVHHGPNGSDIYMVLFEEGDFFIRSTKLRPSLHCNCAILMA